MFPNTVGVVSGSVTRPADTTAYVSGDLIANSTTAASVVPIQLTPNIASGPGVGAQIRRIRFRTSSTSVTNTSFRVHLFTTGTITCANGDNGSFSVSAVANYLGSVDITAGQAFTDGAFGAATTEINLGGVQIVYCLIEARAAYTPTSGEVITVTAEVWQQ